MAACPFCLAVAIKYGFQGNGVQKYFCNICHKIFNARYGTPLYRMRQHDKDLKEIVHLFFKGVPISTIAEVKEVYESGVRSFLQKTVTHFEKWEQYTDYDGGYVPEVVEVDEIYIKLQDGETFWAWIAYDPVNKVFLDFEIGQRDAETVERLFKRLKKYRGKVKLVMVDGYKAYKDLVVKYLARNGHKPSVGVINKSKYSAQLQGFVTYGLFGEGRLTLEQLVKQYGLGSKISTALIERLNRTVRDLSSYMKRRSHRNALLLKWVMLSFKAVRFFHNFVKAHLTLSVKSSKNWITEPVTPAMKAGITNKQLSIAELLLLPITN